MEANQSEETGGPPERPRSAEPMRRRVKAQREGHVGGRRVPDANEAAVRIQSCWRSKLVRKAQRRKSLFATELQRQVRGMLQRMRFSKDRDRLRKIRQEESVRLDRLRRIRTRERELAMLRALPADQYISVDRIRREASAKLIQRLWRKLHPKKKAIRGSPKSEGNPLQLRVDELHQHILKRLPEPALQEAMLRSSRATNGTFELFTQGLSNSCFYSL